MRLWCAAMVAAVLLTPAADAGSIRVRNIKTVSSQPPLDQVYAPSFAASAPAAGGTLVAFYSEAGPFLYPNATSGAPCDPWVCRNALLRDMVTGQIELLSKATTGQDGNGPSGDLGLCYALGDRTCESPAITPDGRFVAFISRATDLVASDTAVGCNYDGDQNADDNCQDVFLRDRQLGTTELISVSTEEAGGNGASGHPAISADGRFVAFHSDATNLDPADQNQRRDVFLRDRQQGTTIRISRPRVAGTAGHRGSGQPSISADGTLVAFESTASNLAPADRNTNCDVNGDGLPIDNCPDVFLWNASSDSVQIVSVNVFGQQGDDASGSPSISADGGFVSFESLAGNLVSLDFNGITDIFVRDIDAGTTTLVSLSRDQLGAEEPSLRSTVASGGRFVVFETKARLTSDDANAHVDIYLRDLLRGVTLRLTPDGPPGGRGDSFRATISADGRFVTFDSGAALVGPADGDSDVYLLDRSTCPDGKSIPDGPVSGVLAEDADPLVAEVPPAQDAVGAVGCGAARADGSSGVTSG